MLYAQLHLYFKIRWNAICLYSPTIPSKYPCSFGMCSGDFFVTTTLRAVIGFFLFSFIGGVTEKVAPTISGSGPVPFSIVGVRPGAAPRLDRIQRIQIFIAKGNHQVMRPRWGRTKQDTVFYKYVMPLALKNLLLENCPAKRKQQKTLSG